MSPFLSYHSFACIITSSVTADINAYNFRGIIKDVIVGVMLLFTFVLFVATAPQQEPEAESTADLPNKGLGQTSSGPNSLRDTPVSAPPEKDCDVEKSADSVAVTLS